MGVPLWGVVLVGATAENVWGSSCFSGRPVQLELPIQEWNLLGHYNGRGL
jgi:hypothetical protein